MADKVVASDNLITTGNAADEMCEGNKTGWFIGHFVNPVYGLRCTQNVEVKWGKHSAHEEKPVLGVNEKATTLTLLISGSFVVEFPDLNKSISLNKTGDFVIFAPRVAHTWKALQDSVVLTIRWPSISGDQKQIE